MVPTQKINRRSIKEENVLLSSNTVEIKINRQSVSKNRCSAEKAFRQNCVSWLSLVRQNFSILQPKHFTIPGFMLKQPSIGREWGSIGARMTARRYM